MILLQPFPFPVIVFSGFPHQPTNSPPRLATFPIGQLLLEITAFFTFRSLKDGRSAPKLLDTTRRCHCQSHRVRVW